MARGKTTKTTTKSGSAHLEISPEDFKPLFEEPFENVTYQRLNPFACIRIVHIRPLVRSGIEKLKALFRKSYKHVDDISPVGLCMGTDTPILVPLVGRLQHLVVDHFKHQGLTGVALQKAVSKHETWYGIIDGAHSNEAIKELVVSEPGWQNFKWFVTVLNGEHPVDSYTKLARAHNTRHSDRYYIEMTFYDELNNLRNQYETLLSTQIKPSHTDVAKQYFGGEEVSRTKVFLASMAVRLTSRTIMELGKIMNSDHPDTCLANSNFDCQGAKTAQQVMSTVDCRFFKRFITLHSLRQSTVFMNAKTPQEQEAQVNTLHRAKDVYLNNNLKTVQFRSINEQFRMSLLALIEEEKFLRYDGVEQWPSEMKTIQTNLLKTTLLDDEIQANAGNDLSVLPSLRQALMRADPALVEKEMNA